MLFSRLFRCNRQANNPTPPKVRRPLRLEQLEDRAVPAVSLLSHYDGLSFDQSNGGYVPPDTNGAAQTKGQNAPAARCQQTSATSSGEGRLWASRGSGATLTRERSRAAALGRKLIEVLTGPTQVPWWRRWFR